MKGADVEGVYECDGCGRTGTLAEIDKHILEEQVVDYNDLASIKCWGSMLVGSQVWQDFHTRGIHPMTHVFNMISGAIMEHPEVMPYVFGEGKEEGGDQ